MGQFSYACDKCGKHDQYDWIDDCVVEVGGKSGKLRFVLQQKQFLSLVIGDTD